jgi:integrase
MEQSAFQGPDDLVFARHENGRPISDKRVDDMLYHALEQIKIKQDERERRNITFHSWRVFFNTAALNAGLSEKVVRSLTGHKTDEMTKHYTRPNVGDLDNVTKFQEELLHGTQ